MIELLKIGDTLSQTALAMHLYTNRSWIKRRGDKVDRHGETWQRMVYRSKRCAGYRLIARIRTETA